MGPKPELLEAVGCRGMGWGSLGPMSQGRWGLAPLGQHPVVASHSTPGPSSGGIDQKWGFHGRLSGSPGMGMAKQT